jgi:hypothetical protein
MSQNRSKNLLVKFDKPRGLTIGAPTFFAGAPFSSICRIKPSREMAFGGADQGVD